MLSHYIAIALRMMSRNAGLTAINILGFTIGLAAGLLIYLWVDDELHYDAFHHHSSHIYRVVQMENSGGNVTKNVRNSPMLGEEMQNMFPQIADNAYISCSNDYAYFLLNGNTISALPAIVSGNFFSFFNFQFVEGNPETAFIDPQSIVISDKLARKLFGNQPALGRELTGKYSLYAGEQICRIGGVVKLPHNTHLSFEAAWSNEHYDRGSSGGVYLRFDDRTVFNEQFQESLSRYMVDHTRNRNLLWFQPIRDIHLKTDFIYFHDHNLGNPQYVLVFSILAIIIVLMGAFNFMTISTAQATKRIKEVAVRKVYGGDKKELMGQFFSETLMYVLVAMILALALAKISLPYFNGFTQKEMVINFYDARFWITIAFSLMAVGLVAGSYPALYLSSFSPMAIFKGGNIKGGKAGFTRMLVVLQFFFSIWLIICTLVVFRQLSYIKNKDLGIDKENIITVRSNLWYDVENFKQEVMRNPNVQSVSMSMGTPDFFSHEIQNVTWEGKTTQDTVRMIMAIIDGDFAKTYGLQLVHGDFTSASGEDYWAVQGGGVMINETAVRVMGMDNPVGKTINNQRIVAVVRDFHFRSLKEPVAPLIMTYSMEGAVNISFRLSPVNQPQTIAFIKETYERMRPGTAFEYNYFSEQLSARYRAENQLGSLFLVLTLLSLSISCLGILGLTALSVEQKTKEIGLRKIAGASIISIILLLAKTYVRSIAIAFVIVVPPAALTMNRWLQNFAYNTGLSWWIFLSAGIIALILAIVTIGWLCYKAANQNPVNLLRYE